MVKHHAPRGDRHGGGMYGLLRADTNKDGVLTRAEATAQADARFAKLDPNGDGTVSAEERQTARQAMRDRMGAAGKTRPSRSVDDKRMARRGGRDGNATMTKADFEARALKRFDRMDANHDGKVDQTEIANLAEMRKLRHQKHRSGNMTPPAPPADSGE